MTTLTPNPDAYAALDLQTIRQRWDARAPGWDEALEDPGCHLHLSDAYNRFLAFARTAVSEGPLHRMLDLGCGTGLVARALADLAPHVTGLDLSASMLNVAGRKLQALSLVQGDCFRLPFRNGAFDAVISRGVLMSHYGEQAARALLCDLRAVLRPGGALILDYLTQLAEPERSAHVPVGKVYFESSHIASLVVQAGLRPFLWDCAPGSRTHFVAARR